MPPSIISAAQKAFSGAHWRRGVGRVADITLIRKPICRVSLDIDERYNHIPDTSSLASVLPVCWANNIWR
jgi:hypothetical protein